MDEIADDVGNVVLKIDDDGHVMTDRKHVITVENIQGRWENLKLVCICGEVLAKGRGEILIDAKVMNRLIEHIHPDVYNQPAVPIDSDCVECHEAIESTDKVTWRVRYKPHGLIHEDCQ